MREGEHVATVFAHVSEREMSVIIARRHHRQLHAAEHRGTGIFSDRLDQTIRTHAVAGGDCERFSQCLHRARRDKIGGQLDHRGGTDLAAV